MKGSVLILSLLVTSVLLLFGAIFLSLTLTNYDLLIVSGEVLKAEWYSRAGINRALYGLRTYYFQYENTYISENFGEGKYYIALPTVIGRGIHKILLLSVGESRGNKISIVAEVRVSTPTDFLFFYDSPYQVIGKGPDDSAETGMIFGGPLHANGYMAISTGFDFKPPWGPRGTPFHIVKPSGLAGPAIHTSEYIFHEAQPNAYYQGVQIAEKKTIISEADVKISEYNSFVSTEKEFVFLGDQGSVNYPEFELKWCNSATVGLPYSEEPSTSSEPVYPVYRSGLEPKTNFDGLLEDKGNGGYYIKCPKSADIFKEYVRLIDNNWHIKGNRKQGGRFNITNTCGGTVRSFVNDAIKAKRQIGIGQGSFQYEPVTINIGKGDGINRDFYWFSALRGLYNGLAYRWEPALPSHLNAKNIYVNENKINISDGYVGDYSTAVNSNPVPNSWQYGQVNGWSSMNMLGGIWFENQLSANSEVYVTFTGPWRIYRTDGVTTTFTFHPPRQVIQYFTYPIAEGERTDMWDQNKLAPWVNGASAVYNDTDSTGGAGFTRTDPPAAGKWKWYNSKISLTNAVISTDADAKNVDTLKFGTAPPNSGWIYIDFDSNHPTSPGASWILSYSTTPGNDIMSWSQTTSKKTIAVAYGSDVKADLINKSGNWWGSMWDNNYPGQSFYYFGDIENDKSWLSSWARIWSVGVDPNGDGILTDMVWSTYLYAIAYGQNHITFFKPPQAGSLITKERYDCVYELKDTTVDNYGINPAKNITGPVGYVPSAYWLNAPTWMARNESTSHLCPVKYMEINPESKTITITDPEASGRAICIDQIIDAVEIDLSTIENFPKDPRFPIGWEDINKNGNKDSGEERPGIIFSEVPLIVGGTPKEPVTIVCLEDVYVKSINYVDENNDGKDDRGYTEDDSRLKPVGIISAKVIFVWLWYENEVNKYKCSNVGVNKVALYSQGSHIVYFGGGGLDERTHNFKFIGSSYFGSTYFGEKADFDEFSHSNYTVSFKGTGYRPSMGKSSPLLYASSFRGRSDSTTGNREFPSPHMPVQIEITGYRPLYSQDVQTFLDKYIEMIKTGQNPGSNEFQENVKILLNLLNG